MTPNIRGVSRHSTFIYPLTVGTPAKAVSKWFI